VRHGTGEGRAKGEKRGELIEKAQKPLSECEGKSGEFKRARALESCISTGGAVYTAGTLPGEEFSVVIGKGIRYFLNTEGLPCVALSPLGNLFQCFRGRPILSQYRFHAPLEETDLPVWKRPKEAEPAA
jgi:hypothetical protein